MKKRSMVAYAVVAVGLTAFNVRGEGEANMQDSSVAPMEWMKLDRDKGYVVFNYSTLKNLPPSHVPTPDDVVKKVSCALARDEYESIQIGVHAISNGVKDVRIEVESDLEVTVYHRIDPGVKQKLAETDMPWLSTIPGEVFLQRGDVVADLPRGTSVNFWLTFLADRETSEGPHAGKIRIKPAGKPVTVVDLNVRVRPIVLQTPRAAFGMFYRGGSLPDYRDMAVHGQNSVTFYGAGDFSESPPKSSRLPKSLGLAKEAGLIHPDVPCLILQGNIPNIEEGQRRAAVAWLEAQRLEQGWPEIIVYGWDEPPYPAPGLREEYLPMRDVSMRLGTGMSGTAAYAHGDVHDVWIVHDGHITPEMRAEAERRGAQVWTYSYRILRKGYKPVRQRYYAGLYTWAHRLGGNVVWAYTDGTRHGHVWWLPGSDEPMPVTGWEARREGVDDYRYLQMVEDCAAANEGDPLAVEAAAWLEALRARLTPFDPYLAEAGKPLTFDEYDEIRATASDYIEKLGAPTGRVEPWPVTNLKDEAASFRDRSVKECIAGLGGSHASERRSAAWVLFEMGAEAAPAVDALVAALEDPEVRIPALRALEGIGPDAYSAAPRVSSLLSHADAYVRLGATFALTGMTRPPSWDEDVKGYLPDELSLYARTVVAPLRQALRDGDRSVVQMAALGLFLSGEAGAPALPDAMALLGPHKEFGLRVLSGIGPGAASAVPVLVKMYEESKGGGDWLTARTLAAIGPAASEAVPILEEYLTPENWYLADACYALYCIRGGESELKTLAEIVGEKSRPRGGAEWRAAARFLSALGSEAASVVPLVRERLPLLDTDPSLRRYIEDVFFKRVEEGAPPLRLLLR